MAGAKKRKTHQSLTSFIPSSRLCVPVPAWTLRPPREVSDDAAAGWILARVIKYVPDRDQYHVRDEDDHSNLMTVSSSNVIRLTEENIGDVKKDDTVSHTRKRH